MSFPPRKVSLVALSGGASFARSINEPSKIDPRLPIIKEGKGSNWIHQALQTAKTLRCGYGVIATKNISEGTLLIVFGGKIITLDEFESLSDEMKKYPYQVDGELFIGPVDSSNIGIGERVNHSCNPNAGFYGAIHLVAIRDISAWEQITIDYATCVAANQGSFTIDCVCESSACRKVITGQDWQLKDVQSRLLSFYQPFLKERVRARKERSRSLR